MSQYFLLRTECWEYCWEYCWELRIYMLRIYIRRLRAFAKVHSLLHLFAKTNIAASRLFVCSHTKYRANVCSLQSKVRVYRAKKTCALYWAIDLTLIERNPPPRGGFLFTMFPHQEPWVRGPPSKNFVPGASRGVLLLTVLDEGTY